MMPIYICDDDKEMRMMLKEEIKRQLLIGNHSMKIMLCTGNPEELIATVKSCGKRGIYFLDVDLKQADSAKDGFWLGKEIRKYDPSGFLIYVTSFGDLAFKTFQYHLEALDYIRKDDRMQLIPAIRRCLNTIVNRIGEEKHIENPVCLTVKLADSVRYIPVPDIICLETSSRTHRVILYTESERLDFIGKLSEISDSLGSGFIRCHRSFLVNSEKIRSIDWKKNEITMSSGQVCLVSRSAKPALRRVFE